MAAGSVANTMDNKFPLYAMDCCQRQLETFDVTSVDANFKTAETRYRQSLPATCAHEPDHPAAPLCSAWRRAWSLGLDCWTSSSTTALDFPAPLPNMAEPPSAAEPPTPRVAQIEANVRPANAVVQQPLH